MWSDVSAAYSDSITAGDSIAAGDSITAGYLLAQRRIPLLTGLRC